MSAASVRASSATISPRRKLVTLINVFTVEPANQRQLLELLGRATETCVRQRPVSFLPACIAVSMEQRSRCTLNGAASKIPESMKWPKPTPELR